MESSARKSSTWRENDAKANKQGQHRTVFWVKSNPALEESRRTGAPAPDGKYVTGNRYVGEWEDNQQTGFGTFTWANGSKYEGEWDTNRRQGKGTMWVRQGRKLRKQYTGDWHADKRQGLGIFYHVNGDRFEGEFVANKRNGRGKMVYASGDVYEGDWVEDRRSGLGVMTLTNGDRFEGQWLNNKKEGQGRFYYAATRKVYEGEWVEDVAKCGTYSDATAADMTHSEFGGPEDAYDEGYTFELPTLALKDSVEVAEDASSSVRAAREPERTRATLVQLFSAEDLKQLEFAFQAGTDGGARDYVRGNELGVVFDQLGMRPSEKELEQLLSDLEVDLTAEIFFEDFVQLMNRLRNWL